MLSATPERRRVLVFSALAFIACILNNGLGPLKFTHDIGADYQIQRLALHLATFVDSVFLCTSLGVEFPY
jgi:hypothetical protein